MSTAAREAADVLHIPVEEGRTFLVLTELVTFKLGAAQTKGAFFLATSLVPPQGGVILHTQPAQQETFFVVEGSFEISWLKAGQARVLNASAGSIIHIPEGVPHSYKNVGDTPGRLLFLLAPAGKAAQLFEEVGTVVTDPLSPPAPVIPDLATLRALARKYGLELVAPSMGGGEE